MSICQSRDCELRVWPTWKAHAPLLQTHGQRLNDSNQWYWMTWMYLLVLMTFDLHASDFKGSLICQHWWQMAILLFKSSQGHLMLWIRPGLSLYSYSCIPRFGNGKNWSSEQRSRSKVNVIFKSRSPDVVYLFSIKYVQIMLSYWCLYAAISYYTNMWL